VEDALERLGHDVVAIDAGGDLVQRLRAAAPDVAFIALHGRDGEDGTVQELLEVLRVPYTGSGVSSCIRCADKVLAKHVLREAGVPTPAWHAFTSFAFRELGAADALGALEDDLAFPIVVKPARQGSALGIKVAGSSAEVPGALLAAFSYDAKVLLERYVAGRELAVSVLDGDALPVVEAIPRDGTAYDFEARYEIGRTDFVCPADVPDEVVGVALDAVRALGCAGYARVDLILGEDGPQVLEVNTVPGLTDTSLLPQAADAAGLDFDALVERVVALGLGATAPRP
jgi:D-alanine-D-alanine ligase